MPKAAGKATFGAIIGIFSSLFYCFSVFYPIFATKSPLKKWQNRTKSPLKKWQNRTKSPLKNVHEFKKSPLENVHSIKSNTS